MAENECIENLNILVRRWEDDENMYSDTLGIEIDQEFMSCIYKSIEALKEIQQYRAIGTVEECREARERQIGKKPEMKPFFKDMEEEYLCCPTCGDILTDRVPTDNKDFYFHCLNCGQKFDWSDV